MTLNRARPVFPSPRGHHDTFRRAQASGRSVQSVRGGQWALEWFYVPLLFREALGRLSEPFHRPVGMLRREPHEELRPRLRQRIRALEVDTGGRVSGIVTGTPHSNLSRPAQAGLQER